MLASLFLMSASLTAPQMSVQAANQTIVEDGAGGISAAVNRILGGIIGYARWPDGERGGTRTMCLVGTPRMTDRLAPLVPGGPAVTVRRTTAAAVTGQSDCDILFLARMPVADRQRLIGWARGRPVLTITDDDPGCLYGAMFCLGTRASSVSFSVDLDAVGRGTLRIDPRVLKIGQDGGAS